MECTNKLYGKTAIWNGDSICAGSSVYGNWATRIAERNSMAFKNYALGGGTLTGNPPKTVSGHSRHSVCDTLDLMYEEYPDADYIIIEGGSNDADLLGFLNVGDKPTRLGHFEPNYYGGEFDTETFSGALESIFYRATKYWCGKHIGYIIPQKMGYSNVDKYNSRRAYFDRAAEICKKWGIPYIDLWNGCYLNPKLPWIYDNTKTSNENAAENISFYIDGQHLTARGYDFTSELIEAWMRTI